MCIARQLMGLYRAAAAVAGLPIDRLTKLEGCRHGCPYRAEAVRMQTFDSVESSAFAGAVEPAAVHKTIFAEPVQLALLAKELPP